MVYRPRQVTSLADKKIIDIAAGKGFSLAVDDKGEVYGWGSAQYGVLGNGDNSQKKLPTRNTAYDLLRERNPKHYLKGIKSTHYCSLGLAGSHL